MVDMQECFTYVNVLHFIVFCFYFGLACAIAAEGFRNNPLRIMVYMLLMFFSIGSMGKFLQHIPCTSYDFFIIVYYACQLPWIAIAPMGALIALKIAGLDKKPYYTLLTGIFALYAAAVYIAAAHGFVDKFELTGFGWKITNSGTFWGLLYARVDDLSSAIIVGCIIYFSVRSRDRIQKLQAASLITGVVVTLFFIYLFRFIPGATALSNSPNLYLFSTALGIFAAMKLYGFIELTPSFAANAIFQNAFEMMALIKNDGTIEAANRSLSMEVCGKENGCNGIPFSSIFAGSGAIAGQILLHTAEKGSVHSEFATLKKAGGGEAHCLLSAVLLKKFGINYGIVCVISDITELRKAEKQLEEYRRRLEELVAKRTEELGIANKKLEIRVKSTEDFVKASYHDLREPVSSVSRLLHLITDKAKECATPEIMPLMKEASEMAVRTDSLISDIRDYMFIDNTYSPELSVDLNESLNRALSSLRETILSRKAVIKTGAALPVITGSRIHAEMIFSRLIDNAIKFNTSAVPEVDISAGDNGEIRVSDNGIGIKEEYLTRIFNAFERLHSRQEYKGNGMGLAVCRKIALLHGGEIRAEAGKNGGSVFIFKL